MDSLLEVNVSTLRQNVILIRSYLGKKVKLCAVVKANAYGHGVEMCKYIDAQVDCFAVATANEAFELVRLGIKSKILVLTFPSENEIDKIIRHNIAITIASWTDITILERYLKENSNAHCVECHLKVDVGMNRQGFKDLNIFNNALKIIKNSKRIALTGLYTHFSENNLKYVDDRMQLFQNYIKIANKEFKDLICHASSSYGFLQGSKYHLDMVRVGILLYGEYPCEGVRDLIKVCPVATLSGSVVATKQIKAGEKIGYGGTYVAPKDSKIAIVRLGYADGLKRCLSNIGELVINNKRVKIVGNICMDLCMADILDINVQQGDRAYAMCEEIRASEVASLSETISYEIFTSVSERVRRKYLF